MGFFDFLFKPPQKSTSQLTSETSKHEEEKPKNIPEAPNGSDDKSRILKIFDCDLAAFPDDKFKLNGKFIDSYGSIYSTHVVKFNKLDRGIFSDLSIIKYEDHTNYHFWNNSIKNLDVYEIEEFSKELVGILGVDSSGKGELSYSDLDAISQCFKKSAGYDDDDQIERFWSDDKFSHTAIFEVTKTECSIVIYEYSETKPKQPRLWNHLSSSYDEIFDSYPQKLGDNWDELVCELAGGQYHDGKKVLKQLYKGALLDLKPEADNEYDEDAVRVYFLDYFLGYIPKEFSKIVGTMIKQNIKYTALAAGINKDGYPFDFIKILILRNF